ncbi:NAD-dependent deacetylase [Pseudidiomarina planktonica]|uniref:NAD-dependent protein deacylase n=1 Tax=Pseudidiomarina planktonica TaxID=1323738 RepID=A0A1Y6FW35_9GAMM|nr:Sir2 family NAD-dependent protein deacetylase [Pseudidiomarina planktonica]RUO63928.1 NAD-dependent protein deacylase [Pseudidiomarina planktonica]SMQ79991.1 NAD-dependent deacetylase [Pseudidiomarina planktonica]
MAAAKPNLVVLSGAGISAESGLATFRDNGGLWNNYSVYDVATPEAFHKNPELVLDFYNQRRNDVRKAKPNPAHEALAEAEEQFNVHIVTQNVDDLHERAGSSNVIHVHGLITQARSSVTQELYELADKDIQIGDKCPQGAQLRPHVVWFGEYIYHMDEAVQLVENADIVVVVGTSLSVFPFAGLVEYASPEAKCYLITQDLDQVPTGFEYRQGSASQLLPKLLTELTN